MQPTVLARAFDLTVFAIYVLKEQGNDWRENSGCIALNSSAGPWRRGASQCN
jgi:hypothetical protein